MKTTIMCGKCDFPAYLHTDEDRADYWHICGRNQQSINANREYVDHVVRSVTKQVPAGFKNSVVPYKVDTSFTKTTQDYLIDDSTVIEKALITYLSTWSYKERKGSYLAALQGEYLPADVEGPEADGTTIPGKRMVSITYDKNNKPIKDYYFDEPLVDKDRDITGIGVEDYDDPNASVNPYDFFGVIPEDEFDPLPTNQWTDGTYDPTGDASWVSTSLLGEEPGEVTVVHRTTRRGKAYHSISPAPDFTQSISHSAYVEGFDGFSTVETSDAKRGGLDLDKTLRHHARLLNVYRKQGRLRVGGVEIIHNVDGSVTARCVRDECYSNSKRDSGGNFLPPHRQGFSKNLAHEAHWAETQGLDISAHLTETMQEFAWAVIAHGNNHAASFIQKKAVHVTECRAFRTNRHQDCNRKECTSLFYKVHRFNCDLDKCDNAVPYCAHLKAEPTMEERIEELAALLNTRS